MCTRHIQTLLFSFNYQCKFSNSAKLQDFDLSASLKQRIEPAKYDISGPSFADFVSGKFERRQEQILFKKERDEKLKGIKSHKSTVSSRLESKKKNGFLPCLNPLLLAYKFTYR